MKDERLKECDVVCGVELNGDESACLHTVDEMCGGRDKADCDCENGGENNE